MYEFLNESNFIGITGASIFSTACLLDLTSEWVSRPHCDNRLVFKMDICWQTPALVMSYKR